MHAGNKLSSQDESEKSGNLVSGTRIVQDCFEAPTCCYEARNTHSHLTRRTRETAREAGQAEAEAARRRASDIRNPARTDTPDSANVLGFWGTCVQKVELGSGPIYLSGWITVFCSWNKKGCLMYPENTPSAMSSPFSYRTHEELKLDGVQYYHLDTDKICSLYQLLSTTLLMRLPTTRVWWPEWSGCRLRSPRMKVIWTRSSQCRVVDVQS